MSFAAGTLVRARGREWVVLPESEADFLVVRPLGGTLQETAGIHTALEPVAPASFAPPSAQDLGDHVSCRLLRDAVRLGFRSSAGPFRSFGRLAFQPRPYQLVPLLMALKLDPVRMLIADDVGIGKTIEACLVARELLDRGEITRLCVLCPPHLAEQWQKELAGKFNIAAELVIPSTARRLERNLRADQSIFDAHPFVVVSMDFIKSDRRRHDFLRTCPDFVIVDEAHTCALGKTEKDLETRRHGDTEIVSLSPRLRVSPSSHQRHLVLSRLAEDAARHLVLVTATPHSGNEDAFRSLLRLLDPGFAELPNDLSGPDNAHHRRRLAAHLVQRRRPDLRHFLNRDTPFPEREDKEDHYQLSPGYKSLFERVLTYARETVADTSGGQLRQRVRWWSALSLLRALASSPAAAAATLRERAPALEAIDAAEADERGRKAVLDATEDQGEETSDVLPGADPEPEVGENPTRRRLLAFAREADALRGDGDQKLTRLVPLLQGLLRDGFKPIVFCRFIHTAEYLAEELRARLAKSVDITCITSQLPPEERSARIESINDDERQARVLVCTDCLSEGINLQSLFDAVVHYDLSWNPTRHEQRDGRVDRFGQKRKTVRVLTYYGTDNQIDGIVLDVLLRKHIKIRSATGVSVPMPVDSEHVVKAVFEGLLLKSKSGPGASAQLLLAEEWLLPEKQTLHAEWERVADREKRSRTLFAQESIKFQDVAAELDAAEHAIGSPQEVASFFRDSLHLCGAVVSGERSIEVNLAGTPPGLRDALGQSSSLRCSFEPVPDRKVTALHRTHTLVEGLASYVLNSALDSERRRDMETRRHGDVLVGGVSPSSRLPVSPSSRAGVMRTRGVSTRTVLLLLRLRFHIITSVRDEERHLLAEDALLAAFTGEPDAPIWLESADTEALLAAQPDANVPPDIAANALERITSRHESLMPRLQTLADQRGEELLAAHRRVRTAAGARGTYRIEGNPPDLLGVYVYLPVVKL